METKKQAKKTSLQVGKVSLMVKANPRKGHRCSFCKQPGHKINKCPKIDRIGKKYPKIMVV